MELVHPLNNRIRHMHTFHFFRGYLLCCTYCSPNSPLAVPTNLTQQGRLLDSNGVPVEGTHVLTVQLFDGPISKQFSLG